MFSFGGVFMCGRYVIFPEEEDREIQDIINAIKEKYRDTESFATGEIFPTNTVPVITKNQANTWDVNLFKWGFPNFKQTSGVIINARSETLTEKPSFRNLFYKKRCLIPANGFYEWKTENTKKVKCLIRVEDQKSFYMAGLYNNFIDKNGKTFAGFVIITKSANEQMSKIHNRMPILLGRETGESWLDGEINDFKIDYPLLIHILTNNL